MSYQLATGGGGRPRRDHGRARAQTPAPARCVAFGRRSLQHPATGRQPRHRCRLRHHPPRAPVAAGHRRDRPRVAPRRAAAVRRSPRYMLDIWAFRTFTVQPGENRCEADESPPNSPVTAFTAPRIEQRLGGLLFVGAARKTWPATPPRHRIGEDEPARPGRSRLRKPLMMFVVIAVVLVAAFGLLDGLVRARIKRRRTGDSGVRVPSTPALVVRPRNARPGQAAARHRRPGAPPSTPPNDPHWSPAGSTRSRATPSTPRSSSWRSG